jgi:hypothetical protein
MKDSAGLRAAVIAFSLLIPVSLGAQSVETRIERAAERVEQSRADDLDIMAPRLFGRAEERLAEARRRYDQGGRIDDIDRRIDEALDALDEAEDLDSIGSAILGEALAARTDALEVGAPDYAEEDWERA